MIRAQCREADVFYFYVWEFFLAITIPYISTFYPHRSKHFKRSRRVEWEHVVPAQSFGQSFKKWREGDSKCVNKKGKAFKGRKCAEKVNMEYRYMQADLYNLVPANGQVNAIRSNYSYAMIPG
jgi:deoxyribonuclease-1